MSVTSHLICTLLQNSHTIPYPQNIERYAEETEKNVMETEDFELLSPEEQLEHLRGNYKTSWIGCIFTKPKGRGVKRNRRGNFAYSLIPKMKADLQVTVHLAEVGTKMSPSPQISTMVEL